MLSFSVVNNAEEEEIDLPFDDLSSSNME